MLTALLGAFTLLGYVFIYTPLKRVTTLNTVIGAIPGAIPPMMGFTAVHGALSPGALALFAILFLWQMPHFLAIAILYGRRRRWLDSRCCRWWMRIGCRPAGRFVLYSDRADSGSACCRP